MPAAARLNGRSPDSIVVGAGVTGTSIAWRLAEAGKRVLLLDKRGVCSGASGRNGGMTGAGSSLHASSRTGKAVCALTTANLALVKTLAEELGKDFELRLPGTMDVITTQEQFAHLQRAVAAEREAGIDVELLDPRRSAVGDAYPRTRHSGRGLYAGPRAPLAICPRDGDGRRRRAPRRRDPHGGRGRTPGPLGRSRHRRRRRR